MDAVRYIPLAVWAWLVVSVLLWPFVHGSEKAHLTGGSEGERIMCYFWPLFVPLWVLSFVVWLLPKRGR